MMRLQAIRAVVVAGILGGLIAAPSMAQESGAYNDIDYWLNHHTFDGDLTFGFALDESEEMISFARETTTPPNGFLLRDLDITAYLGEGQLLDVHLITPREREQAFSFRFRDYGVADVESTWTDVDYNSFPFTETSRWTRSLQSFRFTRPEWFGVHARRDHIAHAGLREFGHINGEQLTHSVAVPFVFDGGDVQGTVELLHQDYTDHAQRWRDIETTRAAGSLQYELGDRQYISGALAQSRADAEGWANHHEVRHTTLQYSDLAVGGNDNWRLKVRGDWRDTEETYTRNYISDEDWTATASLGYRDTGFKLEGKLRTGERRRLRPDGIGLGELIDNPEIAQFAAGEFLTDTLEETEWSLRGQWRPTADWLVTAQYESAQVADTPLYLPPFAEETGARESLFLSDQEKLKASIRYTINPGRQLQLNGWTHFRELDARDSSQRFSRWDVTYIDATDAFSWNVRIGGYENSLSVAQLQNFSNEVVLVGGGFSAPLGDDWHVSVDGTFADCAGAESYQEIVSSIGLEYQVDDRWSLSASYALQELEFDSLALGDVDAHRVSLYAEFDL